MKTLYTIGLLLLSNVFMTVAWYGHLRFFGSGAAQTAQTASTAAATQTGITKALPLIAVILISWGIAFFEYCFQIPANRIGFSGNGGPFSLFQLKIIQEVISLTVFTLFALLVFRTETFRWNHAASFLCILAAVWFAFRK